MTLDCLCDGHVKLSLLTGAAKLRRSIHNVCVLCLSKYMMCCVYIETISFSVLPFRQSLIIALCTCVNCEFHSYTDITTPNLVLLVMSCHDVNVRQCIITKRGDSLLKKKLCCALEAQRWPFLTGLTLGSYPAGLRYKRSARIEKIGV